MRSFIVLAVFLPALAQQDATIQIPPVKTSVTIDNQPVNITASGVLSKVSEDKSGQVWSIRAAGDLVDLQAHMTDILRAELNRSDRCGEQIDIQHATLAPAEPASLLTTQLHYERWACVKAFGKQMVKKLVAGNGVVQVKITPVVEGNKSVRLTAETGTVEADGSLGDLLRSGSLGDMLREKIGKTILSAMDKANLNATLPPAVQEMVSLQGAQFTNAGAGRLGVELRGELHLTGEQFQFLMGRLKQPR